LFCNWVRQKAAEALGEIGDKKAVEPLTQALRDKYEFVRWNAADALKKINKASGRTTDTSTKG
jgi:HEAT repeat protein